ncbi:galactose-proton symport [Lineolata rhizophorae]|uniref:Galactose-proton symport n=1 Tax=Lineolata rhizophorae TaxID=578093 RepID=A0A6A6NVS9_9PEZI|nr:galactose-proton symport [Lineolata rhizophorae]
MTDSATMPPSSSTQDLDFTTLMRVERSPKAFGSRLVSLVSLPAGSRLCAMDAATPGRKAYSSVQVSRTQHVELNSDLVYCNHSCAPSLEFDTARREVRVARARDLRAGDPLTFFYPSSEWDMAQPFECNCGAGEGVCLGWVCGAKALDEEVLERYWLNAHIVEMLEERRKGREGMNREKGEAGTENSTEGSA